MANSQPKMSTIHIDPVNAVPSFPKLTILGFQHVLAGQLSFRWLLPPDWDSIRQPLFT